MPSNLKKQIQLHEVRIANHKCSFREQYSAILDETKQLLASPRAIAVAFLIGFSWAYKPKTKVHLIGRTLQAIEDLSMWATVGKFIKSVIQTRKQS